MATKKTNGTSKTPSSKPVAKTTVSAPPSTPTNTPAPSAPTTTQESVSMPTSTNSSVTYGDKQPPIKLKKLWIIIGVAVIVTLVFICGLALGGAFKKAPPDTDKKTTTRQESTDDRVQAKVENPSRTFFSGVLPCPANEWSETVYIRESLKWKFPLGVPYVYMLDENGQEIPCDGVENPVVAEGRVNSIKFKYRVKKNLLIEQVPFAKKEPEVEKK